MSKGTVRLSQIEAKALADFAVKVLLDEVGFGGNGSEWRRPDDPSFDEQRRRAAEADRRHGVPELEIGEVFLAGERSSILTTAAVCAVMRGSELAFAEVRGLPEPAPYVELNFSDAARDWLQGIWEELRDDEETEQWDDAVFIRDLLGQIVPQLEGAALEMA